MDKRRPVAPDVGFLRELAGSLVEIGAERWQADALCLEYRLRVDWFPERGVSTEAAKAVCGRCLVQAECLDYAMRTDIRDGVWGGLSPAERKKGKYDLPA